MRLQEYANGYLVVLVDGRIASTVGFSTLHELGSVGVDNCFESIVTLSGLNTNTNSW